MPTSFWKDKVCLVTGGARGIGRAIADRFSASGAKVMICDKFAADDLPDSFGFVAGDVGSKTDFEKAFSAAEQKFGKVDVLVNNAGILSEADYEDVVRVNLLGVMHGSKVALERMAPAGVVINIASLAGVMLLPQAPAYSATKAAVIHYTRCFGDDLYFGLHGIRFICVCPGFVRTTMINKEFLSPEDQNLWNFIGEVAADAERSGNFLLPEDLADNLVDLIPEAANGSVWAIEKGSEPKLVPKPVL